MESPVNRNLRSSNCGFLVAVNYHHEFVGEAKKLGPLSLIFIGSLKIVDGLPQVEIFLIIHEQQSGHLVIFRQHSRPYNIVVSFATQPTFVSRCFRWVLPTPSSIDSTIKLNLATLV